MKFKYWFILLLLIVLSSCDSSKSNKSFGKDKTVSNAKDFLEESVDAFLELPNRKTQREVKKNDLYGSWGLTHRSIDRIEKFDNKWPDWEGITFPADSFQLQANNLVLGHFNASYIKERDLIDFFMLSDYKDTLAIVGKWDLEGDTIYGYRLVAQFEFPENHTHFYALDCAEEDGKLVLWSYIGDPDDLEYQNYKKIE